MLPIEARCLIDFRVYLKLGLEFRPHILAQASLVHGPLSFCCFQKQQQTMGRVTSLGTRSLRSFSHDWSLAL